MQTADVVLLQDSLTGLVRALDLCKATTNTIRYALNESIPQN